MIRSVIFVEPRLLLKLALDCCITPLLSMKSPLLVTVSQFILANEEPPITLSVSFTITVWHVRFCNKIEEPGEVCKIFPKNETTPKKCYQRIR
jgi:hypothetical protein